ncbi:MAG: metallophosphoesterase family protein [Planctomycetota bacterium]
MRIAIVSDIHANLAAFEAVLAHAKSVGYDAIVCLGDVVGYGPDPVECIDLVRAHCEWTLLGNHDFAAVYEPTNFNPVARKAAFWTRDRIFDSTKPESVDAYLASLAAQHASGAILPATLAELEKGAKDPKGRAEFMFRISPRQILLDRYICVHGSPSRPVNEYMFPSDVEQASYRLERNFRMLSLTTPAGEERRANAIVGHTHSPGFFLEEDQGVIEWLDFPRGVAEWTPSVDEMPPEARFILNPGSVGQPRDGDPRSSYAILTTGENDQPDRFTFHRVEYDIARTQGKIRGLIAAGAPLDDWLAARLELGQ